MISYYNSIITSDIEHGLPGLGSVHLFPPSTPSTPLIKGPVNHREELGGVTGTFHQLVWKSKFRRFRRPPASSNLARSSLTPMPLLLNCLFDSTDGYLSTLPRFDVILLAITHPHTNTPMPRPCIHKPMDTDWLEPHSRMGASLHGLF